MFEKVGVPILGIVENMAVEYGMDYLGALPLDMPIRVQADSGKPTLVADPDGDVAAIYKAAARKVAITVAASILSVPRRPATSRNLRSQYPARAGEGVQGADCQGSIGMLVPHFGFRKKRIARPRT